MTAPVESAPDEQPIETPEVVEAIAPPPAFVIPDRADAPVSEVTERFLRAILLHVPIEQIEELHLFSPLRQGTVETGIAVIAARVPTVDPAPMPGVDAPELEFGSESVATPEGDGAVERATGDEGALPTDEVVEAAVDGTATTSSAAGAEDVEADALVAPPAPEVRDPVVQEPVVREPVVREPVVRHTVYTARYRYVIKGPERGKWEASVKAEAEAPLITVETVVRGVQRRAGEDSEIVRFTGAQIAKALKR